MYTLYQCFNLSMTTTEGFGDATPKPAEVPTNVDTNNSIKTLAQLATDLQSGGGLKVPGNLSIGNGTHVLQPGADSYLRLVDDKGTYTDFASNNMWVNGKLIKSTDKWHTSTDGKNRVYYAANSRTYFGSQGGYKWRNKSDNVDIMTLGDNGNLSVGGMDIVTSIKDLQTQVNEMKTQLTSLNVSLSLSKAFH